MERRYINSVRNNYADLLIENGDTERALEIARNNTYSPIMKVREIHPEEEPNPKEFNETIKEIVYDLSILNTEFAATGYKLKELMANTKLRLQEVERMFLFEQERQQDLNMLCNAYSEFSSVINLGEEDFTGAFTEENNIFSAHIEEIRPVAYTVESIDGNGYEGNKYVYKDNKFTETIMSTGERKYINDSSLITAYEYSRITASNTETEIFPLVNFDSIEARCSITIKSDFSFNTLKLSSDTSNTEILQVLVSDDGIQFKEALKRTAGVINDKIKKYELQDYIPGSGIVCFPESKYLRIVLQSNGHTNDTIAFEKIKLVGGEAQQ